MRGVEGRHLLRRPGRPDGGGDPADPEADDARSGHSPILWHIMKWYASWGHTDFVLFLGYRAETAQGLLPSRTMRRSRTISSFRTAGANWSSSAPTSPIGGSHSSIRAPKSTDRRAAQSWSSPYIGDDPMFPGDVRRRAHGRAARRHDRRRSGRTGKTRAVRLGAAAA